MPTPDRCPCGSGVAYATCCEPAITGRRPAASSEALMRSRYTAFCAQNMEYLLASMAPETRADFDLEGNREWARKARFTGLEILDSQEEGDRGFVAFRARFEIGGQLQHHAEKSTFRRIAGRWYFVEGQPG